LPEFSALNKDDYKKNAGRIADVNSLNETISGITRTLTTDQMIAMMNQIGVAASKINTIAEVTRDPLVAGKLVRAKDERTGFELTLAPPPHRTAFLEERGYRLSFPPRFGEHNEAIYGKALSISSDELAALKNDGII